MGELSEKVNKAIETLKAFEPDDGYYLCYSGGKDSDCIRILADLANVKHEIHHNLTTVDAPETVYYVKSIPGVIIDKPRITMWKLIEKKMMPPTRIVRYCCTELKERGGRGRLSITGVRKAESKSRAEHADTIQISQKKITTQREAEKQGVEYRITKNGTVLLNDDNDTNRRFVEQCYRTRKTMVNPIVEWSETDVWDFLKAHGCSSNPLYQCGYSRVGCIGCPMGGSHRKAELEQYPKYKQAYIHAFDRMLEHRKQENKDDKWWSNGEDVMRWWLQEPEWQQLTMDDMELIEEIQEEIMHPDR